MIETKPPILAIEYQPGFFNPSAIPIGIVYANETPNLSGVTTVERAVKIAELGDVEDARFCEHINTPFFSGCDFNKTKDFVTTWAVELADKHIANTHPDFEIAKDRMTTAYTKLFQLEQTLRAFVQQQLEVLYSSQWWDKVPEAVRNKVTKREADPTKQWFDDFSPSRLKFADFDDLRLTILANWPDFKAKLGDRDLFHLNMAYVARARHRIAHVNTLSADDAREFITQADRILKIVQPHTELR